MSSALKRVTHAKHHQLPKKSNFHADDDDDNGDNVEGWQPVGPLTIGGIRGMPDSYVSTSGYLLSLTMMVMTVMRIMMRIVRKKKTRIMIMF